ncbi:MAG: hypothetical protein OZ921_05545 [Sorangiineae bacterium]|nr:hypothetical protein [Polyangiaceae bacterium]MEB2321958.1 hypothetical protein [Sorangiineae bacterium]
MALALVMAGCSSSSGGASGSGGATGSGGASGSAGCSGDGCGSGDCLTPVSDFESGGDVAAGFTNTQVQRGSVEVDADPVEPTNHVARMTAGEKVGDQVGKADLIVAYPAIGAGHRVVASGRFFFPADSSLDSLILMDIECASCGLDTNPGIRLYLRDGALRVDRSKIGLTDAFLPTSPTLVTTGTWHSLVWQVTLGIGDAGRSDVYLDGVQVMSATGTTLISQAIIDQVAPGITVKERADRLQIGLTANSNPTSQTLFLDDVAMCVD